MVNQPDLSAMKKPTNAPPTNQDMQALAAGDLEEPRRIENKDDPSVADEAQKRRRPPSPRKPEEVAQPGTQAPSASDDDGHNDKEELEKFIEKLK